MLEAAHERAVDQFGLNERDGPDAVHVELELAGPDVGSSDHERCMTSAEQVDERVRIGRCLRSADRVDDTAVGAEDVVSIGRTAGWRRLGLDDLAGVLDAELGAVEHGASEGSATLTHRRVAGDFVEEDGEIVRVAAGEVVRECLGFFAESGESFRSPRQATFGEPVLEFGSGQCSVGSIGVASGDRKVVDEGARGRRPVRPWLDGVSVRWRMSGRTCTVTPGSSSGVARSSVAIVTMPPSIRPFRAAARSTTTASPQ